MKNKKCEICGEEIIDKYVNGRLIRTEVKESFVYLDCEPHCCRIKLEEKKK